MQKKKKFKKTCIVLSDFISALKQAWPIVLDISNRSQVAAVLHTITNIGGVAKMATG